jgi:glycosyltransferase involved in cell wall biosynthesis
MSKPHLVFVVTEDWYFYSHRLPMVRAAQEAGCRVSLITNVKSHQDKIEAHGVKVIPFSFERRNMNPFKAIGQINELRQIYKKIKPDIVHHIAMKPILIGGMAAILARVPFCVHAFAGLGYIFYAKKPLALFLRMALWLPFFLVLSRKNNIVLFQNNDDLEYLQNLKLVRTQVRENTKRPPHTLIIRGSGVDTDHYAFIPKPPPQPIIHCAYAGRMIGIKGLETLYQAFKILKKEDAQIHLHLYGMPDKENPGSWTLARLKKWQEENPLVHFHGYHDDMAQMWSQTHVAIQVSYGGEGVPKSLIEAASCGCAIIASNVPGCRDMVENGQNGYLVEAYDAYAIVVAMQKLADSRSMIERMGHKSRALVLSRFSQEIVQTQTAAMYRDCLAVIEA